jgi:hypothetical protein
MDTANPTAANRTEAARLAAEGHPNDMTVGMLINDLLVSCYIGSDGEPQHEARTDGSCRCGYRKPRTNR